MDSAAKMNTRAQQPNSNLQLMSSLCFLNINDTTKAFLKPIHVQTCRSVHAHGSGGNISRTFLYTFTTVYVLGFSIRVVHTLTIDTSDVMLQFFLDTLAQIINSTLHFLVVSTFIALPTLTCEL